MTDDNNGEEKRTNYRRRAVGALICLAPLGLGVASVAWGRVYSHTAPRLIDGINIGLIALTVLVALLNFYLSWIRPLLFQHRPGYRFVSGFPGIGTILVTAGIAIGFGGLFQAVVGMVALLLDTGSSVWFLIGTWHDSGLWDS